MKNINKNKIVSISFLVIIAVFSILTLGKINANISIEDIKNINVDENYSKDTSKIILLGNELRAVVGNVESLFNENVYKKMEFIEVNGYFQKLLGKNVIDDVDKGRTVIKDKSGCLHFYNNTKLRDTKYQVKKVEKLNKFCDDNDIKFIYVQPPSKVNKQENQLPIGITDYSNDILDNFIEGIKEKNVDYIDLRDYIKEESINYEDIFYKTDHHWTIDSAFWAYTKILNKLNEEDSTIFTDFDSTIDTKNYDTKLMKKSFVGSQGKRVGKYYTDLDDVKLYIPKFKTDLSCSLFGSNGQMTRKEQGDFYNSLIDIKDMESDDLYVPKYESLLYSNRETHIVNNLAKNDTKVLYIKDSFARPVAGYMSLNVKETRLLDLRYYKGSTYEYIKEYKPDVVIMLYGSTSVKNKGMFNFDS